MLRKMPNRRVDPPEPFGEPVDTEESYAYFDAFCRRIGLDPFAGKTLDEWEAWEKRDGDQARAEEPDPETEAECRQAAE